MHVNCTVILMILNQDTLLHLEIEVMQRLADPSACEVHRKIQNRIQKVKCWH